ncbi:RluA family pseudouridine synthase [Jeotgalibacillus proteolyticus]|uniref:Pseudouridine synthase n=1 Tax=Jeotgalibacillus proteolyticus TaxID=2082395 RepID=A0A2S5GHC0_9BACL|nr:RluA family pseudouridine synthase [Jeotgalibacillus proteolyticus]PPA72450.1 RluA family pseudouridine synthase [Jeotgalibacillus proteolyticus]
MTNEFSIKITDKIAGKTIEQALKEEWKFGKKLIHEWRMEKAIALNGELAQWKTVLAQGDRLTIRNKEDQQTYTPAKMNLTILHEDEHLLVINKPPYLDTHPNDPADSGTLVNAVVYYLQQKGGTGYTQPIHRLDRDTTGAILFAKHSAIKPLLDRLLEQRMIKRTYWALAEGNVTPSSGTINEPIGNDRHHNTRKRVSKGGQSAVTHFKKISFSPETNQTWLELNLDTGRTHQIRVHLAHIGHPLAGDTLYGGKKIASQTIQALHAARLSFTNPLSGEFIAADAPDPVLPPRFSIKKA